MRQMRNKCNTHAVIMCLVHINTFTMRALERWTFSFVSYFNIAWSISAGAVRFIRCGIKLLIRHPWTGWYFIKCVQISSLFYPFSTISSPLHSKYVHRKMNYLQEVIKMVTKRWFPFFKPLRTDILEHFWTIYYDNQNSWFVYRFLTCIET